MNIDGLSYDLSPLGTLTHLEIAWSDLEARADCPFFLTWNWIGTVAGQRAERWLCR